MSLSNRVPAPSKTGPEGFAQPQSLDRQHAEAFARIDAAFARANPEGIRPPPPVDDGFEPAVFDFADVRREREDG